MKDTHFLYLIAALAVIGITTVFIAYATDTLPKHTPRVIYSAPPKLTTEAKKCGCCSEKIDALTQIFKNKDVEDAWVEFVDNYNR